MIVCQNGVFLDNTQLVFGGSNRSFRYGDGFFESIRLVDGRALFLSFHFDRILETATFLKLVLPENFSLHYFEKLILDLAKANTINKGGQVRLTFYREGGGFYLPESNRCSFFMEASPLADNLFVFASTGLKVGIFSQVPKQKGQLSNYKTNNALPYVLASIYCKEQGLEDSLLVNEDGNIVESTNSNVFVILDKKLITPPLSEGCLNGVFRKRMIMFLKGRGVEVSERPISPEEIREAEEILLTNAIRGPRWAHGIGKGDSFHCQQWINWLNEDLPNLG